MGNLCVLSYLLLLCVYLYRDSTNIIIAKTIKKTGKYVFLRKAIKDKTNNINIFFSK